MTKISMKRGSILSIVLIAASAVTAAVLPSKGNSDRNNLVDPNANGTVTTSTESPSPNHSQTCDPRNSASAFNCHITVDSGTTGGDQETDGYTTA